MTHASRSARFSVDWNGHMVMMKLEQSNHTGLSDCESCWRTPARIENRTEWEFRNYVIVRNNKIPESSSRHRDRFTVPTHDTLRSSVSDAVFTAEPCPQIHSERAVDTI
jgi:hypothetical protein